MGQEPGKVTTVQVPLPGLKEMFEGAPESASVSKKPISLASDMKNLPLESRKHIAVIMSSVWKRESKLVGIEWDIEEAKFWIYVSEEPMFHQRTLLQNEQEHLLDMLVLMLKLRPNLKKLKWDFSNEYVEIDFIPRS
jgi:hypothetical protein